MVTLIALRATILAAALVGLAVWTAFIRHRPQRGGYGLAALIRLLNIAAFEFGRLAFPHSMDEHMLNVWAQAILLQGALTLAGIGLFLARMR